MTPTRFLTRSAQHLSHSHNSRPTFSHPRSLSSTSSATLSPNPNIHALLATPTWSVRSLLPPSSSSPPASDPSSLTPETTTTINPTTLHHLLRLSSLPPPPTPSTEATLLATLATQLHFVRAIQAVDTRGVAPLTAIRDESSAATNTITLETLHAALAAESKVGFRGRPRRARGGESERCAQEVLVEERTRARREGAYYVVESGKAKGGE